MVHSWVADRSELALCGVRRGSLEPKSRGMKTSQEVVPVLHERELLCDGPVAARARERDGLRGSHNRRGLVAQGRSPQDLCAGGRHRRPVRSLCPCS